MARDTRLVTEIGQELIDQAMAEHGGPGSPQPAIEEPPAPPDAAAPDGGYEPGAHDGDLAMKVDYILDCLDRIEAHLGIPKPDAATA